MSSGLGRQWKCKIRSDQMITFIKQNNNFYINSLRYKNYLQMTFGLCSLIENTKNIKKRHQKQNILQLAFYIHPSSSFCCDLTSHTCVHLCVVFDSCVRLSL